MTLKLATYRAGGGSRVAAVAGDLAFDLEQAHALFVQEGAGRESALNAHCMVCVLEGGEEAVAEAKACAGFVSSLAETQRSAVAVDLATAAFLPPVPRPNKLLCLAGNYVEHITESKKEHRRDVHKSDVATPRIFMKPPSTTVIGHNAPVRIPRVGHFVDWEAELAVVIGKRGKYIQPEEAFDYVGGYTALNDISERELKIWERPEKREWDGFFDWLNGKWGDGFAPCGPYLVPACEVADPHNLALKLRLNGEIKQDSNTSRMIFGVPQILAYASSLCTLEPGDLIATGTPAGVGHPQGIKLQPGDVLETELEGVGVLRSPVEAEDA